MPLDKNLQDILACPLCRSKLSYDKEKNILICKADNIYYPVKDDIPILLINEAKDLIDKDE